MKATDHPLPCPLGENDTRCDILCLDISEKVCSGRCAQCGLTVNLNPQKKADQPKIEALRTAAATCEKERADAQATENARPKKDPTDPTVQGVTDPPPATAVKVEAGIGEGRGESAEAVVDGRTADRQGGS